MTGPRDDGITGNGNSKCGENKETGKNSDLTLDVRSLLGTDEKKKRFKNRRYSKLILIINISFYKLG